MRKRPPRRDDPSAVAVTAAAEVTPELRAFLHRGFEQADEELFGPGVGAGLATAAATRLPGSVAAAATAVPGAATVRLGHPGGILSAGVVTGDGPAGPRLVEVSVTMTGRRIMEGVIYG